MVKKLFILLIALMVVSGYFSGCARRRDSTAAPVTEESGSSIGSDEVPKPDEEQPVSDRKIDLTTPRSDQTPSSQPRRIIRESRPVQQKDQLLSMRRGVTYSPEDFEIGALQGSAEDRNIQLILERIRSFQQGLGAGRIPVEDIHSAWLNSAQRTLGFHVDRGNIPIDVRIGLIDIYIPGRARANIRFTGKPGIAYGEIYLEKEKDAWLVSDLQIDLAGLADSREKRTELYEPSVYRMMDLP